MKFIIKKQNVVRFLMVSILLVLIPVQAFCITARQEEELSREFMKYILQHAEFIEDPVIVDYVNSVGKKIVSTLPSPTFEYRFYILNDYTYNAFASPAGQIFINSGLFEAMDNEEELAGILGHEIAHVACRHISEKIERAKKISLVTLAGLAAGIFLGAGSAATAGSALTIGSMAAGQSIALAYSRNDEIQADQMGLKYLKKAGYNGSGLLSSLKKIRNKQWFGSKNIPTYLTTHPAVEDRIAYIGGVLEENPELKNRKSNKPDHGFAVAHTRLIAMYGDKQTGLKKFKADIDKYPESLIAHYGYGLILARTGNRKDAVAHLKIALEKNAFDPDLLRDIGRIYFLDGQYLKALNSLNGALCMAPDDPETLFFLGRTQTQLGKLDNAILTFKKLLAKNPDYTRALFFLGNSYGKSGRLAEAHYYLGIYYQEKENHKNAEFHLKKALEKTSDQDKKTEIEERLEQVNKRSVKKKQDESKS